jgi:hypothetical protein
MPCGFISSKCKFSSYWFQWTCHIPTLPHSLKLCVFFHCLGRLAWGVWIGFDWLRIGTSGKLLWMWWWTFRFLCHGVSLSFHCLDLAKYSTEVLLIRFVTCPPPSWTTPYLLSMTAYSTYSQLSSISGGCLLHLEPEYWSCHGRERIPLNMALVSAINVKSICIQILYSCYAVVNSTKIWNDTWQHEHLPSSKATS